MGSDRIWRDINEATARERAREAVRHVGRRRRTQRFLVWGALLGVAFVAGMATMFAIEPLLPSAARETIAKGQTYIADLWESSSEANGGGTIAADPTATPLSRPSEAVAAVNHFTRAFVENDREALAQWSSPLYLAEATRKAQGAFAYLIKYRLVDEDPQCTRTGITCSVNAVVKGEAVLLGERVALDFGGTFSVVYDRVGERYLVADAPLGRNF